MTRSWQGTLLALLGWLLAAATAAVGCSDDDGQRPPPPNLEDGGAEGEGGSAGTSGLPSDGGGGSGGGGDDVLVGKCSWGSERECRIYVGDPPGSEGCWVGMQYCINETWTECDTRAVPASVSEDG